jgi:CheY-like chemotaxis protein
MRVRVLHLEDDESDRELVARTLRAEGIDCAIVQADSRGDFERALDEPPDLILSDYSIPSFAGDEAQDLAQARCPGAVRVRVWLESQPWRVQPRCEPQRIRAQRVRAGEVVAMTEPEDVIDSPLLHQLKNHLSIVIRFCDPLLGDLPQDDPKRVDIQEMRKAGQAELDRLPDLSARMR